MENQVIAGRFRVLRKIGEGGMGTVYEAQHEVLPRRFAIKILRPEVSRDRSFIERFKREAIAAGSVEHPNVIYITDFGAMEDGALYLVMEYLQGVGLDELLGQRSRLPINRALPILAQVADALDAAHRVNVVHRDLKPENILLTEVRGQRDVVKILDFGIAKVQTPKYENLAVTMKGQVFGTAEYMSPEQATGEPLDGRSDLYAVGCLAYEMLTGDPPFTGSAVSVLQAHVRTMPPPPSSRIKGEHLIPPALDALILRCLAKDPAARYQTGAELRRDLLKARGLLFGMSDEIVARNRSTGPLPTVDARRRMTEGWKSLGGSVPEILTGPALGGQPLSDSMVPATATSSQPVQTVSPDQARAAIHDVLRELALALVRVVLAPPETSESLERLLVIEEEVASLTGTIALGEQNFDRIRFEFGQREKRLRYAILDLNMEQAQLRGRAAADPTSQAALQTQVDDLGFQISELGNRCSDLERERSQQIAELAAEVKGYRDTRAKLEQETAEIFQALHAQVEMLRPAAAPHAELAELYQRLDELRAALEHARQG
jgi:serine/threonine protein kinase